MSEENVAALKRFHEAVNRSQLGTALDYLHPAVEVRPALSAPDVPVSFVGHAGMREWFKATNDAFQSLTVEIEETIEAPKNRIVAVERWRAVGRDGIEAAAELIDVYRFRDGRIIRIDGFRDKAEALEAAGLSE